MGVYRLPAPGDRLSSEPPNILGKHGERVISLKFGPKDTVVSGSEDKTMKVSVRAASCRNGDVSRLMGFCGSRRYAEVLGKKCDCGECDLMFARGA